MAEGKDSITLRRPDDWHVRLGGDTMFVALAPDRKGGR
jgi:dihydroorotase